MDKFCEIRVPIAHDNLSIKRNENKCVLCGRCKDVCKKKMSVDGHYDYDKNDIICINCGQCLKACPVGAISEQDGCQNFIDALKNPKKTVVAIISPAVRVALGEEFGLPAGEFVAGKIVSAVKALGVDYCFDVTFGADLTVMEEASELIERIKENKLPMFTSCCPSWVKFAESFYPEMKEKLSSCKSPIGMQSSIIKNYFAKAKSIDVNNLFIVAITPCVSKKAEIKRQEYLGIYGQDTDLVLTTTEFAKLINKNGINFTNLKDEKFDEFLPTGSGSGIMFGASGGVMEATIRTAYYLVNKKDAPLDLIKFNFYNNNPYIRTAEIELMNKKVNLCVVCGTDNVRKVLEDEDIKFDFVEVMACPNGCVGGGGQPKEKSFADDIEARGKELFSQDEKSKIRFSYKNPIIKKVYKEFLEKPLSDKAIKFLHIDKKGE